MGVRRLVVTLAVLLSLDLARHSRRIQGTPTHPLQMVTDNTAAFLAHGLFERIREVQVLADADVIWSHGLDSAEVKNVLARQQAMQPHSLWLGVADAQGVVRAATNNMLLGQTWKNGPGSGLVCKRPTWATSPRQAAGKPVAPTKSGDPYRL